MDSSRDLAAAGETAAARSVIDFRLAAVFEKNDCIIIDDVEQLQKTNTAAYATLHAQEITSLIAAPIFLDNKLAGYIGIDNYDSEKIKNSSYLLLSMSIFFPMRSDIGIMSICCIASATTIC